MERGHERERESHLYPLFFSQLLFFPCMYCTLNGKILLLFFYSSYPLKTKPYITIMILDSRKHIIYYSLSIQPL